MKLESSNHSDIANNMRIVANSNKRKAKSQTREFEVISKLSQ